MTDWEQAERALARLEAWVLLHGATPATTAEIQQLQGRLDEIEFEAAEDWIRERDMMLGERCSR